MAVKAVAVPNKQEKKGKDAPFFLLLLGIGVTAVGWFALRGRKPSTAVIVMGKVTDTTGAPIVGAVVSLDSHTATSDAGGNYRVTGLTPADYTGTCAAAGFITQDVTIGMTAGGTYTLNVVMSQEALPIVVRGKVTDEATGLPIAGAVVVLQSVTNEYQATTAADGTYSLMDLVSDTYAVGCAADNYLPASSEVSAITGGEYTVNLVMTPVPITIRLPAVERNSPRWYWLSPYSWSQIYNPAGMSGSGGPIGPILILDTQQLANQWFQISRYLVRFYGDAGNAGLATSGALRLLCNSKRQQQTPYQNLGVVLCAITNPSLTFVENDFYKVNIGLRLSDDIRYLSEMSPGNWLQWNLNQAGVDYMKAHSGNICFALVWENDASMEEPFWPGPMSGMQLTFGSNPATDAELVVGIGFTRLQRRGNGMKWVRAVISIAMAGTVIYGFIMKMVPWEDSGPSPLPQSAGGITTVARKRRLKHRQSWTSSKRRYWN